MKVVSFNTLAQVWIDDDLRYHAVDRRHLSRAYRVRRQIEWLSKLDGDIVFLQEVTPIVLAAYKKALPQYDGFDQCFACMEWQPSREWHAINGNAILWRKGLFEGAPKCQRVILDKARGISATLLTPRFAHTRERVALMCVHFDWDPTEKKYQPQQFRNIFDLGYIRPTMKRVIIAGDFNMSTRHIDSDMTKRHLVDVTENRRTHPFPAPEDPGITHILIRGFKPVGRASIPSAASIGATLKKFGSDHFPVVATLTTPRRRD